MDDISLIIESLTPEQYKNLFKDLPIPSITINHNRDKYIEELSNNIYQKKILNTMLNNNFNISSVSDNSISILVDLNNGKIIKYLKEHLDKTNIDINIKDLNYSKIVLGLNDVTLCKYINISRMTLNRWMNQKNTPDYETLERVYNKLYESNLYLNRTKEEMYNSSIKANHKVLFHGAKAEIVGDPSIKNHMIIY